MTASHIVITPATIQHIPGVVELFRQELGREPDLEYITHAISNYPSALAWDQNTLAGFVYSTRFAPDILELANLLVAETYRGVGVGAALVAELEAQARGRFRGVILSNSDRFTLSGGRAKPDASGFYSGLGFDLVACTGETRVFWKELA